MSAARHRGKNADLAGAENLLVIFGMFLVDRHPNDPVMFERFRRSPTVMTWAGRSIASPDLPIRSRTQAK